MKSLWAKCSSHFFHICLSTTSPSEVWFVIHLTSTIWNWNWFKLFCIFHFNSVDEVRESLLCILHNNFYIIYICIIFYTPIETSVNKKQLQHVSMLVIAEECEGSWKQPWEVWEAKEVKIIDVESDLDHGKFGEAKEIKIIDENIVKQSHYWLLFFLNQRFQI